MRSITVLAVLIGALAGSRGASFIPASHAMERFTPPGEQQRRSAVGATAGLPPPLERAFDPVDDFQPIPTPGPSDWLANHPQPRQTFDQ